MNSSGKSLGKRPITHARANIWLTAGIVLFVIAMIALVFSLRQSGYLPPSLAGAARRLAVNRRAIRRVTICLTNACRRSTRRDRAARTRPARRR